MLFGANPSVEALRTMEDHFAQQGTTGFLAAMATNTTEVLMKGVSEAKCFRERYKSKGSFWGIHFEGPYLSSARRGAHPHELIAHADELAVRNLLDGALGVVKMMTVAPEVVDTLALREIQESDIVISVGHSNSTYEQGIKAFTIDNIPAVTHLYNAMPPMHHREPGLVAAVFECGPYASIVADGIHVSFAMIKLAKRLLGEKLFLITDAVTDCLEGVYPHVWCGDHYTMPDGTLSGSALTMLKAVQNCVVHCDIPIREAIRMASEYPAKVINVADSKGQIKEGYDADFVVFNDDWQVKKTYIKGRSVFDIQ